jgi:hypothetical protein
MYVSQQRFVIPTGARSAEWRDLLCAVALVVAVVLVFVLIVVIPTGARSAERRNPLFALPSKPIGAQIFPGRAFLGDQRNLLLASPPLDLFFPRNRPIHVLKGLKPNEPVAFVLRRESLKLPVLGLPCTCSNRRGDAAVKRTAPVRHQIDEVRMLPVSGHCG